LPWCLVLGDAVDFGEAGDAVAGLEQGRLAQVVDAGLRAVSAICMALPPSRMILWMSSVIGITW
jgi:hypothetical protein